MVGAAGYCFGMHSLIVDSYSNILLFHFYLLYRDFVSVITSISRLCQCHTLYIATLSVSYLLYRDFVSVITSISRLCQCHTFYIATLSVSYLLYRDLVSVIPSISLLCVMPCYSSTRRNDGEPTAGEL